MITDRTFAVVHMAEECGVDAAADHYGLSRETVRRRMREVRSYERENTSCDSGDEDEGRIRDVVSDNKYLEMIEQRYTPAELKIIARGYLPKAKRTTPIHDFHDGDWVTIGVMSDLHLGSIYTNPDLVADVYEQFDLAKVDMVAIAGDVLEGMSQRPGHIYELSHLGYTTQVKHAVDVISAWTKTPIYMIDGNHDRWFIKSSGAYAVADICSKIPNAQFLGNDEGSIWLDKEKTVECRLWHGEDGSCFDDQTKILTQRGWILFSDLTYEDKVATMTKDQHKFEWQQPTNIFIQDYDGPMIHFKSRTIDSMVTPNHGMWTRVSNSATYRRKENLEYPTKSHIRLQTNWHRKEAQDIVNEYGRQKWQFTRHCNSWNGITPETVKIPYRESKNPGVKVHHYGQVKTEDIAELIAWYVTEGHSRKACTTISQYQTVNPQNHQHIINLMNRIGGKFTHHNKGIRIHSMELAEWLTTTCGSGSRNKYLPTWLKECDTSILQLVLDTMIKGDGWEMGVSWGYRSISPQLLNDFVEIAIKCGYGVTFVKGNDSVTITKCQHEPTVTSHPKELHYEGKIYCCEVPNGLILVQRNGKTLWTHNSYAISYRLQKLVESFSGGKKPNILFGGHVHKQGYFQIRNIQCFGAGCIQAQSAWMRSKRLSAETGFWVVRLKINNRGISRVQSEWFPFYL